VLSTSSSVGLVMSHQRTRLFCRCMSCIVKDRWCCLPLHIPCVTSSVSDCSHVGQQSVTNMFVRAQLTASTWCSLMGIKTLVYNIQSSTHTIIYGSMNDHVQHTTSVPDILKATKHAVLYAQTPPCCVCS